MEGSDRGVRRLCRRSVCFCQKERGSSAHPAAAARQLWYQDCIGKPNRTDWEAMLGRRYTPPVLKKGTFTMDNTVMEMKDCSLVMRIMFKAIEASIARSFGGKRDYENPEFRILMASSAGAAGSSVCLTSQIC